jgi:uncharacterized RDD family membrane protein YckC
LIDTLILSSFVLIEGLYLQAEMPAAIAIAGLITSYLCTHFYMIFLHATYGQTLGKMVMKIKVLDVSENPINWRQAVLRESPNIVFSLFFLSSEIYQITTEGIGETFRDAFFYNAVFVLITFWAIAEVIVTLSNEKRRAIHDYIAGTVVVKLNPN